MTSSTGSKLLFLDQHVWVALAKSRAASELGLEDRLKDLVASGRLRVALSGQNYLELWHRREDYSRASVAAVMRDVSLYWTFAALQQLENSELHRVLERWGSGDRSAPTPLEREAVVGKGVNHAFASATGRLRLVESTHSEGEPEGPQVEPSTELLNLIQSATPEQWEWFSLAGFEQLHEFQGMEIAPEHRLGDEYVAKHEEVRAYVAHVGGDRGFVGDETLLVRCLAGLQLNEWAETISAVWPGDEVRCHFDSPADGLALIAAVPTAHVRMRLEAAAHQNREYSYRQHDRGDVYTISQTLPYSDAVYPDKHWAHLVQSSGLDRAYGTVVLRSTSDLFAYLNKLA